jgi:hypothetical protein
MTPNRGIAARGSVRDVVTVRELSYVLRFERRTKDAPTVARGLVTVTSLDGGAAPVCTERVELGGQAAYKNTVERDPKNPNRFTESGVITFGTTSEHTLRFSTIGQGTLQPPADPATGMTPGIVMWRIDSGTGFFANASGLIASNFRVDLNSEQLVDDQVAYIRLPDEAAA